MHHVRQTRALIDTIVPQRPQRVSSYVPAHPWHLETYYINQLLRRVANPLTRITWECLRPVVMAYRAPTERRDDDLSEFTIAIGEAQLRFAQEVDIDQEAREAVAVTAPKVEAFTLAQQAKSLRVLGIDAVGKDLFLDGERRAWTRANVELIKTIPGEYFPKVEKHIIQAVHAGMRHETLAKKLRDEVLPMSKTRASVIARDQVSKYNGALAKAQQTAVGVEKYQWRAVHDKRTRETHLALDMSIQRWDDAPAIGNPGEPIQCRCQACPVI